MNNKLKKRLELLGYILVGIGIAGIVLDKSSIYPYVCIGGYFLIGFGLRGS